MKKDFIVRRTITIVDGRPHVETYSEQELVRCKDCKYRETIYCPFYQKYKGTKYDDWFCADGKPKSTNEQVSDKVDWKKELVDDFEKHLHGDKDGILYHHYCKKCAFDWWSEEAFPNRCSQCGCELI